VQVSRPNHRLKAAVERTSRRDQTQGDKDGQRAQLPRRLDLGHHAYRHAKTVRGHSAATDNVCLLHLVECQRQGKNIHEEYTQHPAKHTGKSSKSHMRSIQSHVQSSTRRRSTPPTNRAADIEAQHQRYHSASLKQTHSVHFKPSGKQVTTY
jgi:hypothetical protein